MVFSAVYKKKLYQLIMCLYASFKRVINYLNDTAIVAIVLSDLWYKFASKKYLVHVYQFKSVPMMPALKEKP